MTTYNLNGLTESQLRVTAKALDVYARLGLGQFRDALECLPFKDEPGFDEWELMGEVSKILAPHMIHEINGIGRSLGINSPELKEKHRTAFDACKVIRHFLAHKNRPLQPGQMPSVDHDTPIKYSAEPLPTITEYT